MLLLDVVDVELLFFVVVYVSGVLSVTLRVPESDSLLIIPTRLFRRRTPRGGGFGWDGVGLEIEGGHPVLVFPIGGGGPTTEHRA